MLHHGGNLGKYLGISGRGNGCVDSIVICRNACGIQCGF